MNKQSVDSSILSNSGITVKTANPIYIDSSKKSPNDYYLNLDASSSSSDIAAFQSYAKSKGAYLGNAGVDGKWGGYTSAAWNIYGDQYLASLNQANTQPNISTQPTNQPTETAKKEAAKKGLVWDSINNKFAKAKESGLLDTVLGIFGVAKPQQETINQSNENIGGEKSKMSTTVKVVIGVGAILVIGGIIYAVTKKSK